MTMFEDPLSLVALVAALGLIAALGTWLSPRTEEQKGDSPA